MKTCNKCKTKKVYKAFHKDRSRLDGYHGTCKDCKKKMPSCKRGTVAYFFKQTWHVLNKRTINGKYPDRNNPKNEIYFKKGVRLEMTRDQFKEFCELNKQSILKLYKDGKTPSLDRVNSKKHYSVENIEIISLRDNIKKSHNEKGQ